MPTLSAGASATLTLTDSDSVTIQTTGVLTVTAVSGLGIVAGKVGEYTGSHVFGPYSAGSITLSAAGASCYYEVADGAYTAVEQARVATDSAGRARKIVTDGGSSFGLTARVPSLVVAGVGSSTIAANTTASGRTTNTNASGYVAWAATLSKGGIFMPHTHNFGINGDGTASMLSRIPLVLSANPVPDICVITPFANDINALNPFAVSAAHVLDMVAQLQAGGVVPVLVMPQPTRGGTSNTQGQFAYAHQWMRNTFSAMPGVILLDIVDLVLDPSSATYESRANALVDNLHLNADSAQKIGKRLWEKLLDAGVVSRNIALQSNADLYNATYNPTGNLIDNGMMSGSAAAATSADVLAGSLATGWLLTGSGMNGSQVTPSKVSASGIDWQRLSFSGTATSGNGGAVFYRDVAVPSNVAAGDVLELTCEINAGATTGIATVAPHLRVIEGGVTYDTIGMASSNNPGPTDAWNGVIKTATFALQAVPTTVRARIVVHINAGSNVSTTGNIDISRVAIRKVPRA